MSACFWNTTPRSAPGPVTGLPSSSIVPSETGRKPAMQLSSVVLPQPEGPQQAGALEGRDLERDTR